MKPSSFINMAEQKVVMIAAYAIVDEKIKILKIFKLSDRLSFV